MKPILRQYKCGCQIRAGEYEPSLEMCLIHDAADELLNACREVVYTRTIGQISDHGIDRLKTYEIPRETMDIIYQAINKATKG